MTEIMDLARLGSKTLTSEHVNGLAAMHAVRQTPMGKADLPKGPRPLVPAYVFAQTVAAQGHNPLARA